VTNRRTLLKYLAAVGASTLSGHVRAAEPAAGKRPGFFGLHPFVEDNPGAVFVIQTDVRDRGDAEAMKANGLRLARELMLPFESAGIPLTWKIPVKPNLTDSLVNNKDFSLDYGMGIVTDPYFVEGVIEGMKELGLSGRQFFIREVNAPECFGPRGYTAMAERTGADLRDLSTDVREMGKEFVQWKEVPDGVVHRRIPYLWPVNATETFHLNIPKFKTHGTGMTLCCKNHQGTVAAKYQRFCHGSGAIGNYHYEFTAPDAVEACRKLYDRHLAGGFPYWDKLVEPGKENSLWLDMWCQRTLDNLSVSPMGLCIVEGIFGREGCFLWGPNPPKNNTKGLKEARDYPTNVLIFGKNPIFVDIIGHWMGGHEPGWFGFFHIARERGMSAVVDPRKIPVYRWENGSAILTPLERFPRTPMRADYIPKDHYFGTEGEKFYMYDEPYNYGKLGETVPPTTLTPGVLVLDRCMPRPENPVIPIAYTLDRDGYARLDILDSGGKSIGTPVNGYRLRGAHCAAWDIRNRPAGKYAYRFAYGDFEKTKGFEVRKG
jgi:hypothetical protein